MRHQSNAVQECVPLGAQIREREPTLSKADDERRGRYSRTEGGLLILTYTLLAADDGLELPGVGTGVEMPGVITRLGTLL